MPIFDTILSGLHLPATVQDFFHPHHHTTSFAADGSDGLEFREYYASACPHCKHLEAPWKAAVGQYSGPVKWTQIECNDENWAPVPGNEEKCAGIPGFPTMKMFKGGKEIDEYQGDRTSEALLNYVRGFEAQAPQTASVPIGATLGLAAINKFLFGEEEKKKKESFF
ncbi:unnamed protein product [Amoebophrya sp. A25]|nr:unnamed protein product [Amoebophrya sp. A25]|eukprot:GSA25T00027576001.1